MPRRPTTSAARPHRLPTALLLAADYHQDYFELNPRQRYCQIVIEPKVAKFRKEHLARLKR